MIFVHGAWQLSRIAVAKMSVKCVKIEPNNEIDKLLYKNFTNKIRKGFIEVGEEKICMQELYSTVADEIENFEVKDSDIFLITHPKAGTTWMQEMLWMIVNNLDLEGGKKCLYERVPFLELQCVIDFGDEEFASLRKNISIFVKESIDMARQLSTTPRIIKTHLPLSLLPKQIRNKTRKPKIINVIRNPKDTCISYYYHCCLLEGYKGNLEDYTKLFIAGRMTWGPYWTHVLGYWNNRNNYNMLTVKYEDMKRDLASVIRKVADFIEFSVSDKMVAQLQEHLSFESMKNNPSVNFADHVSFTKSFSNAEGSFMRTGTVGSYKEDMSAEMIRKFEEWTEKESAGTGLVFDV